MFKFFFVCLLLILITWNVFADFRISVGQKNFQETPFENVFSVPYVGVALDISIPIIKAGVLVDYKIGRELHEENKLIVISDTSYGIKKEFFSIIKPFIALGISQNQMLYTNMKDQDATAKYDGDWASVGVKIAFVTLSLELEYREKKSGNIDFNDGTSYNLDSNTTTFSLGFEF